jgi:DNA-binding MarR family transcriptional regulator
MTETAKKFDLSDYIPCQLAALGYSIMRTVAGVFEDRFGISMPEWKVLAVIVDKPGLAAVAVAQFAQMDTVAVSRAVTKLLDRKLIVRELDSEDRRRSVLNLSAAGAELHGKIVPLADELEANLLSGFSDDERRVLSKAIKTLRSKSELFADSCVSPGPQSRQQMHVPNDTVNVKQRRLRQPLAPLLSFRPTGLSRSYR